MPARWWCWADSELLIGTCSSTCRWSWWTEWCSRFASGPSRVFAAGQYQRRACKIKGKEKRREGLTEDFKNHMQDKAFEYEPMQRRTSVGKECHFSNNLGKEKHERMTVTLLYCFSGNTKKIHKRLLEVPTGSKGMRCNEYIWPDNEQYMYIQWWWNVLS